MVWKPTYFALLVSEGVNKCTCTYACFNPLKDRQADISVHGLALILAFPKTDIASF